MIEIASPFAERARLTQRFGGNPDFYSRWGYKGHNGLDFGVPLRTPVLAVADGVVLKSGFEDGGFGCYVVLMHAGGESIYAHLTSSHLVKGNFVPMGELVGISGNTGASTGPHLHFGIRVTPYDRADGWGGCVDPLPLLPKGAIDEGLTRSMGDYATQQDGYLDGPSGMIDNSEV